MSSEEGSTCVICLEPLVEYAKSGEQQQQQPALGVVVPCGHCLHVDCWGNWAASRLGSGRGTKCPACNQSSETFVRLYVDLGSCSNAGGAYGDDDASLSSCDSDKEENDDDAEGKGVITQDTAAAEAEENADCEAQVECLDLTEMDDNDSSSVVEVIMTNIKAEPAKQQSVRRDKRCSGDHVGAQDSKRRYKHMAKRLKQRVAALESQREELGADRHKLVERLQAQSEQLELKKLHLQEAEDGHRGLERIVDGITLEVTQLKRRHEENCLELARAKQEADAAKAALKENDEVYKRKLSRCSATSMQEVQRMKEERPKLVNEIRSLREQVQKLERLTQSHHSSEMPGQAARSRSSSHKSTKQMLRAMSESRDFGEREATSKPASAHRPTAADELLPSVELESAATLKLSAHAIRIRANIVNPRCRKAPSEALAMLDARDNIQPPLEPILPSFLKPPSKVRRTSGGGSSSVVANPNPAAPRARHTPALHQRSLNFGASR